MSDADANGQGRGVLVDRVFDVLPVPAAADRQGILDAPVGHDEFEAAFRSLEVLHGVEMREPRSSSRSGRSARIAFWNAERLKYLEGSISMLGAQNVDVLLLCEVDVGMARTGNVHTLSVLAEALQSGYVFGTEFVELGLGDLREQHSFAGQANMAGLHGAGFVSRVRLARPALVRLETSGRWFDGSFHERRVGGRIAMMVEVEVGGTPVVFVSVHFESHTDPADRLLQTQVMLDAIDVYAGDRPVLIGGDFNTSTFTLSQKRDPVHVGRALEVDPDRLVAPQSFEPMFALLKSRGYDWEDCNVPLAATQRTRPDGTPQPPFGKIDWFFARQLRCSDPAVVPAVDRDGAAVSDHEALAVTIEA